MNVCAYFNRDFQEEKKIPNHFLAFDLHMMNNENWSLFVFFSLSGTIILLNRFLK